MKSLLIFTFSAIAPLIMAAQVQLTEVNCSNGVDDDGDGLIDCIDPDCMGSPDCGSLNPVLKGVAEGTGTFFEVTNSDYLNITLASSDEITVFLSSVPQMISMNINRPATESAPYEATLTINGLLPSTVYYKYDDSYHNLDSIITDANGNYTWTQDLAEAHHVWIQPSRSTIFICDDATGCGCATVGVWDTVTKTCILTTNVTGAIQIDSPGITLDGGGKSITGAGTGYGILISAKNNVTIKNCVISNFSEGIRLESCNNDTLTNNNITSTGIGIFLNSSTNNALIHNSISLTGYGITLYGGSDINTLDNNNVSNNSNSGIYFYSSSNNSITDNTSNSNQFGINGSLSSQNNFSGNTVTSNIEQGFDFYQCSNNTLINNVADSNGYGIYFYEGSGNTLTGNTIISNTYHGLTFYQCSNNTLINNIASSNRNAIYFYEGLGGNTLTGNITNSNEIGIRLNGCSSNIINDNVALHNIIGILFEGNSNNNSISSNTASNNNYCGFRLDNVTNSSIINNTADSNDIGFSLSYNSGNNFFNNSISSNSDYGIFVQTCQNITIGGTGAQQPNTITNSGIAGIYLIVSNGIKISGNSIYGNPIAILNSDGSNTNKTAPVITSFNGTVVTGTSEPNDIIEIYGSTGDENANEYLTSNTADINGNWSVIVNTAYDGIVATASDGNGNTSILSNYKVETYCNIVLSDDIVCPGDPVTIFLNCLDDGIPFNQQYITFDGLFTNGCNDITSINYIDYPNSGVMDFEFIVPANAQPGVYEICTYGFCTVMNPISDYILNCVNLTVLEIPTIDVLTYDNSICLGETLTIHLETNDDVNNQVFWSSSDPSFTTPANPFDFSVSPNITSTYTVVVSNECGTTSSTFTITIYPIPEIEVIPINGVCLGDLGAADLVVLPDNVNYQVSWSNGQQGINLFYVDGLDGGQYTVTVTHPNGCFASTTFSVEEGTVYINSSITAQSTCPGSAAGSATVTVNGGGGFTTPISYYWSNGYSVTNVASLTNTAFNLSAGTYTVTVVDGNGCTSTASVSVTNFILPHFSLLATAPVCGCDASISVVPAVFSSYLWSNGATTSSINNVCSGNYSVTVTDVNGCTQVQSTTIPLVIPFSVSVSTTNVTCYGYGDGVATVVLPFGTNPASCSYIWSNGGITQTITGLNPGTYSVTVTNSNGCTAVSQGSVIQPHLLTVATYILNQIQCSGVCSGQIGVLLGGGTPPFSYIWSNGSTSAQLNNLCGGLYTLTVTDANGCTAVSLPIILVEPPALNLSLSQTNILCAGDCNGSASINITGGTQPYSYLWCNSQTTSGVSNLCAGVCSVTVTDAHGCSLTSNVTISEPNPISLTTTFVNPTTSTSNDGSATVSVTGGTPGYTYLWSDPAGQTTSTAVGLGAGTFTVTVTDNNGCQSMQTVTLTPLLFNVNLIGSDPCYDADNGYIIAEVSGGSAPYSFIWNTTPQQTTQTAINLTSGTYSVTVTDANNISVIATITLNFINLPGCIGLTNIQTNTLLNTDQTYCDNIVVYNGYSLSINQCTLKFSPNAGIIVLAGGSLHVHNATLTSACPNVMWEGISSINSAGDNSTIWISDNAFIENAETGVYAQGGVYVYCDASNFINNHIDLHFNQTVFEHHVVSNLFQTNTTLCHFPFFNPLSHIINVNNTVGLEIIQNTFENTTTYNGSAITSNRGVGIYSNKLKIGVLENDFNQLYSGILSYNPTVINTNTFTGNTYGAVIAGTGSSAEIRNNVFNIGYMGGSFPANNGNTYPRGLHIENCPTYKVSDNAFSNGYIGLLLKNNTANANVIYRNTFDELDFPAVANQNSNVKFTCNDFGLVTPNINTNILTYLGRIFPVQNHGIVAATPPYTSINTHNRFSNMANATANDALKFNIAGAGWMFNYLYYHSTIDMTRITPTPYDGAGPLPPTNTVIANTSGGIYIPANCDFILSFSSISNKLTDIEFMKEQVETSKMNYSTLVDGNNTSYYLSYIENLKPNNFTTLYNQLLNNAPYISDTVLIAFMLHPINKPAHKKNIVTACSPLPFNVRPYIDQMNINQNFKNQLWALQIGINAKTELEYSIADKEFSTELVFGNLFVDVVNDTITERIDTLLNYVLTNGSISERIIVNPVLVSKERFTDAQYNLSLIDALNVNLPDGQTASIDDFIELQNLSIQLAQSDDSLKKEIIEPYLPWLSIMSADSLHFCQSDAIELMEQYYDTILPRMAYIGDINTFISQRSALSNIKNIEQCILEISPNPANQILNIRINREDEEQEYEAEIVNVKGNMLRSVSFFSGETSKQVNIAEYTPGKYFIVLRTHGTIICVKPVIVE